MVGIEQNEPGGDHEDCINVLQNLKLYTYGFWNVTNIQYNYI